MRVLFDPDALDMGGDAKADMLRSCSCCRMNMGDACTLRICFSAAMDTARSDVFSLDDERCLDLTAVAGRFDAFDAFELNMLDREPATGSSKEKE